MLIDTHKQILVGTGMLGAVPAPSSGQTDGHCYCGEVTGLFIQPIEMRDGEKLVHKFCLQGFAPSGDRIKLYIADTLDEVQRVFQAAFKEIMSPNGGSVTYLNIPLILQQLIQEIEAAEEQAAQATEGGPVPMETVGADGKISPRAFVPRKGGPPVKLVEKEGDHPIGDSPDGEPRMAFEDTKPIGGETPGFMEDPQ